MEQLYRGYKPPLQKQNKSVYINKCMNFILLFLILISLIFIWTYSNSIET